MWKNLMEKFEDISGGIWILIFISLVCIIGFTGTGLANKVTGKMASTNKIIEGYSYTAFDNKPVSGDSVAAEIQAVETPNPNKLKVTVTTGTGTRATTVSYGYDNEADTTYKGYTITDPADKEFINPYGSFKSTLVKNNGVVIGIDFEQQ